MTIERLFINLSSPKGKVDVILDTDAYNEIDDQFAIGYMLKKTEKFNVRGICAAPFTNETILHSDWLLKTALHRCRQPPE